MRAQTIIRVAWFPLLVGGLLALYAPNLPLFVVAAAVFAVALLTQVWASIRVFRLARQGF